MTAGGVTFLDHTADVGMDVAAASLPELLHRAATGMLALLRGDDDAEAGDRSTSDVAPAAAADRKSLTVEVEAEDPVGLLAGWLRELLFLHEVRHRDYVDARFERLDPRGLSAIVDTRPSLRAVREIKGVTYHELDARRGPAGWTARVIFDV